MNFPKSPGLTSVPSEKCFLSSGVDAKLKMWEESEATWVTKSVAGYRSDPIEHFDISEDGSIVTTVQGDKCCIFNAVGLQFTDTLLPPPGEQFEMIKMSPSK